MRKITHSLIILLLLYLFAGCITFSGSGSSVIDASGSFSGAVNMLTRYGISVYLPEGWYFRGNSGTGFICGFQSPDNSIRGTVEAYRHGLEIEDGEMASLSRDMAAKMISISREETWQAGNSRCYVFYTAAGFGTEVLCIINQGKTLLAVNLFSSTNSAEELSGIMKKIASSIKQGRGVAEERFIGGSFHFSSPDRKWVWAGDTAEGSVFTIDTGFMPVSIEVSESKTGTSTPSVNAESRTGSIFIDNHYVKIDFFVFKDDSTVKLYIPYSSGGREYLINISSDSSIFKKPEEILDYTEVTDFLVSNIFFR